MTKLKWDLIKHWRAVVLLLVVLLILGLVLASTASGRWGTLPF